MRSAFVSPSFLVSDSSGGSRGGGGIITPPCPDTENLCKLCVTGIDGPPPPRNVDDVTRAMSKGGGCLWSKRGGGSIFRRADDVTRTISKGGGGACECLHPLLQEILYPRLERDPPPPQKLYPISPTVTKTSPKFQNHSR